MYYYHLTGNVCARSAERYIIYVHTHTHTYILRLFTTVLEATSITRRRKRERERKVDFFLLYEANHTKNPHVGRRDSSAFTVIIIRAHFYLQLLLKTECVVHRRY